MELPVLIVLSCMLLAGAVGSIVLFRRWQMVERLMGEELLVEEAIQDSLRVAIDRSIGNTPPPAQQSLLTDLLNY